MEESRQSKEIVSTIDEIQFHQKIYNFFYLTLRKKDINQFFLCCFFFIETLMLVSFAFSEPHLLTWKLNSNVMSYLNQIIGAFRLTYFFFHLQFKWYLIIWGIIEGYIFLHCLLLTFVIKFNKVNSIFYQMAINVTRYFSSIFPIFGFNSLIEILFLMVKCNQSNKVDIFQNSIQCYEGLHVLYTFLSYIFIICLFFLTFLSVIFYFDPLNNKSITTKFDTSADVLIFFVKFVTVVRYIFIKNEWISIALIFILGLLNFKQGLDYPSYRSLVLQSFICFRNASFVWTGVMLLVCKLTENSSFDGNIYLFLFGFPLVIVTSIVYYIIRENDVLVTSTTMIDVNLFFTKMKYLIYLVENFIDKNQTQKNTKKEYNKNEIYLQGFITLHNESCSNEECPMKKFAENNGNYSIQKTCLLHWVNLLFVEGIKAYPQSKKITMMFIMFNYQFKYNLNTAKTYLAKLETQDNSLLEDYTIFWIQQSVSAHSNNKFFNGNPNDNDEVSRIEDSIEKKFRKLKYLIELSTKLYGEFWGILATNLTNNLNLSKLYSIGNQLNEFLDEINKLWEKELKTKKIELENQAIVQLYIYFVRDILRNKSKSDEIAKKLNEEQLFESKKIDNEKLDLENLDVILESQDLIIYCRSNEKGDCTIIQCSNSVVSLLGYTKQDLIGQNISLMMPSFLINGHEKVVQAKIQLIRGTMGGNKNDKKIVFILPKTKVGYLFPINAKFTLFNDDDFSNTFIIKAKLETKDSKSVYPIYILTKNDLIIDSFSSSALTMGLTMDLLKKYMVNLNILIRGMNHLEPLNIQNSFSDYEEESKKVIWVFPDKIYPKNDSLRHKEENIEKLIQESDTKVYNLLITKIKYIEEDTKGFCFRLTGIERHKNIADLNEFDVTNNRLILYDVLKLRFIKTAIVKEKKKGNFESKKSLSRVYLTQKSISPKISAKKSKKGGVEFTLTHQSDEERSENEMKSQKNILTKEKIVELTAKPSDEIKEFIDILPFYGNDISVERMRPTKERYQAGKTSEPLIKIIVSGFIKRIQDKIKAHPEMIREKKQESSGDASSSYLSNSSILSPINDSSFDSSSLNTNISLGHIFNEKSVIYIQIVSIVIFFLICGIISLEFALSFNKTQDCAKRIDYVDKAYLILNSLLYTKFFVTEAILAQKEDYPILNSDTPDSNSYIKAMMAEMSNYRQIFANTYLHYSNASVEFSKDYYDYISNTQVNIMTISNTEPIKEVLVFSTAMSRIPTSIFYVSTLNDNFSTINLEDRNAYELMMNLLNEYFLVWQSMTFILVQDAKNNAISSNAFLIIYLFSFLVTALSIIAIFKLINKFINDRQKPVDLFLTIKKQKFEEMKVSSEAFLNKLLNKFFGNEETEEESMIQYTATIKADDIMIIKFKQKNEYKQSIRSSREYLICILYLTFVLLGINGYMSFKYFYINSILNNINHLTDIFNITHYTESDIIFTTNKFKSFYFDKNIPILNQDSSQQFNYTFEKMTHYYEKLFIDTYQRTTFLTPEYLNIFYKLMYNNITSLITKEVTSPALKESILKGFSSVCARYFELNRFIALLYFKQPKDNFCYKYHFYEINEAIQNIIRPSFGKLINDLLTVFEHYFDTSVLIQISTFIILLIFILILYFFVWKAYEEKLKVLLKTSVDLIRLIPEEVKKEIVKQLNEEEEKSKNI